MMQEQVVSEKHDLTISETLSRLQNASVKWVAGRINFENAALMEVFDSSDGWVLFKGIDGVLTKVVSRDEKNKASVIACHWVRSGFIPPHYHPEEELVFVTKGSMTLFLKTDQGVYEVPLSEGMSIAIASGQAHAGYVHAGTKYLLTFHPPISVSG